MDDEDRAFRVSDTGATDGAEEQPAECTVPSAPDDEHRGILGGFHESFGWMRKDHRAVQALRSVLTVGGLQRRFEMGVGSVGEFAGAHWYVPGVLRRIVPGSDGMDGGS